MCRMPSRPPTPSTSASSSSTSSKPPHNPPRKQPGPPMCGAFSCPRTTHDHKKQGRLPKEMALRLHPRQAPIRQPRTGPQTRPNPHRKRRNPGRNRPSIRRITKPNSATPHQPIHPHPTPNPRRHPPNQNRKHHPPERRHRTHPRTRHHPPHTSTHGTRPPRPPNRTSNRRPHSNQNHHLQRPTRRPMGRSEE